MTEKILKTAEGSASMSLPLRPIPIASTKETGNLARSTEKKCVMVLETRNVLFDSRFPDTSSAIDKVRNTEKIKIIIIKKGLRR